MTQHPDVAARPSTAHLVQLLLPVYDNNGQRCSRDLFEQVRAELVQAHGGVTAFVRSPAVGAWEDEAGEVCRDDVLLFEVLTDALDREWWRGYRQLLEQRFAQEEIMIRALPAEHL